MGQPDYSGASLITRARVGRTENDKSQHGMTNQATEVQIKVQILESSVVLLSQIVVLCHASIDEQRIFQKTPKRAPYRSLSCLSTEWTTWKDSTKKFAPKEHHTAACPIINMNQVDHLVPSGAATGVNNCSVGVPPQSRT